MGGSSATYARVFDPNVGVEVIAREALEALKVNSPDAQAWWQQYYAEEASRHVPNVEPDADFPEFLANISHLVFDLRCGDGHLTGNSNLFSESRRIEDQ